MSPLSDGSLVKAHPLVFPTGCGDLRQPRLRTDLSPLEWTQHVFRYLDGRVLSALRGQRAVWAYACALCQKPLCVNSLTNDLTLFRSLVISDRTCPARPCNGSAKATRWNGLCNKCLRSRRERTAGKKTFEPTCETEAELSIRHDLGIIVL